MRYFILLLAVLFLLLSCTDIKRDERLGRLDKMDSELNSAYDSLIVIDELDSLLFKGQVTEILERTATLNDTIELADARYFDSLQLLISSSEFYYGTKRKVDSLIQVEKDILEDLRSDLTNDAGKRDQYDVYIQQEEARVNNVLLLISECNETGRFLKSTSERVLTILKDRLFVLTSEEEQLLLD